MWFSQSPTEAETHPYCPAPTSPLIRNFEKGPRRNQVPNESPNKWRCWNQRYRDTKKYIFLILPYYYYPSPRPGGNPPFGPSLFRPLFSTTITPQRCSFPTAVLCVMRGGGLVMVRRVSLANATMIQFAPTRGSRRAPHQRRGSVLLPHRGVRCPHVSASRRGIRAPQNEYKMSPRGGSEVAGSPTKHRPDIHRCRFVVSPPPGWRGG